MSLRGCFVAEAISRKVLGAATSQEHAPRRDINLYELYLICPLAIAAISKRLSICEYYHHNRCRGDF